MAGKRQTAWLWAGWTALTLILLGAAAVTMAYGGSLRPLLLIGRTTDAHHQIELACNSCHTSWFGGRATIEKACLSCHSEDMKKSNDNPSPQKFHTPPNHHRLPNPDP